MQSKSWINWRNCAPPLVHKHTHSKLVNRIIVTRVNKNGDYLCIQSDINCVESATLRSQHSDKILYSCPDWNVNRNIDTWLLSTAHVASFSQILTIFRANLSLSLWSKAVVQPVCTWEKKNTCSGFYFYK